VQLVLPLPKPPTPPKQADWGRLDHPSAIQPMFHAMW